MVATIAWQVSVVTGSTPSYITTTHLRFKDAIDNTNDTNDPLIRPTGGTNYSFEKWLKVFITGTFTQLTNLRVLLSIAAPATGIDYYHGFQGTYRTPVGGGASADATVQLGTSALTWAGAGTHTTPGNLWTGSQHLVTQLRIGVTAVGGEITDWQTTARYDEI